MEIMDNSNLSSEKREDLDLRRVVLEGSNLWYNIKRFEVNTKERGNHELLSIV